MSDDPNAMYKIVRWRRDGHTVIARGLTLAEAQAWCQSEDTHGDGWFDGYDIDPYFDPS